MTLNKIDEYEVICASNKVAPRILLKAGDRFIGQLIFKPRDSSLPQDAMIDGQANLYYHLEDFQNIVDLLRNEKPLYILWSGSNGEKGLNTTPEAVGKADAGW